MKSQLKSVFFKILKSNLQPERDWPPFLCMFKNAEAIVTGICHFKQASGTELIQDPERKISSKGPNGKDNKNKHCVFMCVHVRKRVSG